MLREDIQNAMGKNKSNNNMICHRWTQQIRVDVPKPRGMNQ